MQNDLTIWARSQRLESLGLPRLAAAACVMLVSCASPDGGGGKSNPGADNQPGRSRAASQRVKPVAVRPAPAKPSPKDASAPQPSPMPKTAPTPKDAGVPKQPRALVMATGRRRFPFEIAALETLLVRIPVEGGYYPKCSQTMRTLTLDLVPAKALDIAFEILHARPLSELGRRERKKVTQSFSGYVVGRKVLRKPIDRGGQGAPERYKSHALVGQFFLRITAKKGQGKVLIKTRYFMPRCRFGYGGQPKGMGLDGLFD